MEVIFRFGGRMAEVWRKRGETPSLGAGVTSFRSLSTLMDCLCGMDVQCYELNDTEQMWTTFVPRSIPKARSSGAAKENLIIAITENNQRFLPAWEMSV